MTPTKADVERRARALHALRWPGKAWTGYDVSRAYWRRKARAELVAEAQAVDAVEIAAQEIYRQPDSTTQTPWPELPAVYQAHWRAVARRVLDAVAASTAAR